MALLTFAIDNMHCGACVRSVLQVLRTLPETQTEEVRVGSARVLTEHDPVAVQQALASAGFPARLQPAVEG